MGFMMLVYFHPKQNAFSILKLTSFKIPANNRKAIIFIWLVSYLELELKLEMISPHTHKFISSGAIVPI